MNDILAWLLQQKGGVRTYAEFDQRMHQYRQAQPEQAALARLLGGVARRFAEAYDGEPLAVGTAEEALQRLTVLVERAVNLPAGDAEAKLALLNEIGRTELT